MKPTIGITIGDQAGIGLEIIEKSIPEVKDICNPFIIGESFPKGSITYGKVNAIYSRVAGEAIKKAVEMALRGDIDAIVTAPINKEAFRLGGWDYPGHTEMLAKLTDTEDYAMMLVYRNLRVIHVTTHCSLRQALDLITIERILRTVKTAYFTCQDLGIKEPRIAVAGLNPHSSDGGLFGNEEEKIIIPAIKLARIFANVHPLPIPADVVFARAYGGAFDCVVAMYHDQGHIPLKTLGFVWDKEGNEWGSIDGVNITCGLPIIRTSPDHGVAFGKAGKGTADPTSMISAIKIAVTLVKNRRENALAW